MHKRVLMAAPAVLAAGIALTGCELIKVDATAYKEGPTCVKKLSSDQRKKLGFKTKAQADNAYEVVSVAADRNMGKWGAVVGIATTLQESQLKATAKGDYRGGVPTAFGIFQQRPVSGWRGDVTNPTVAANNFYSRLKKVRGWKSLPLTVAAQSVQRSAFPNAYAKHQGRAEKIVNAMWKGC